MYNLLHTLILLTFRGNEVTVAGNLYPEGLQAMYLAYDNMCNLCRLKVARKPLPLTPPLDHAWLHIRKIIDSFHLRNHVNPECHTTFSPQGLKENHPNANTQAGEQTFIWMAHFKYTAKCYANGRKPVLPRAKSPKADN